MFVSRFFWRIFAVVAGLTLVSTLLIAGMLSARARAEQARHVQEWLREEGRRMIAWQDAHVAESVDPQQWKWPTARTSAWSVHHEIVPVQGPAATSDPVVRRAMQDGEALTHRPRTSGKVPEWMYAVRLGSAEQPRGVLILSLPDDGRIALIPWRDPGFWGIVVLLSGFGLAMTYLVVSRVVHPLQTLTEAARQIAAGQTPREIPTQHHHEIGELAQAFESMNRQLAARINDLQDQRQKLQHNNEQLATVLAAMVEGVIAINEQERVLLANDAALRLLEMSQAAMVGRPIWEVVRQPHIEELVRAALRGEAPARLEFQVARAKTIISAAASRLPGEPCPGAVLVLHDVTELRRLEQLRREFVANVSHELKTPLTSIAAYTETLLEGAIDDPAHNKEFLQRIDEQTERLQALIFDLLSLARMESEVTARELTTVEAGEVITASVDAHHAVADAKQIRLTVSRLPGDALILADADGFRTIMDNLLDNAINYTPTGGGVTIRSQADGDWLQVDVIDTGVGIAREHQTRIFERFFRVDKARSREIGGTGLGLSIVKHLCQSFGGTVSVQSQLGQGSTFSVRLQRSVPGE